MSEPTGTVGQLPAGRYAIGLRTLASLLAGRASYRLVLLATTVALLPVWGEHRYGTYAAAMATFSWLMALVFTGPEKTILKLRPRAPRLGQAVTEALLALLWWLPLPFAVAFLLVLAWQPAGSAAPVYLGVIAMHLSLGATLLLVGLHRAAGRTRPDSLTFLAMTVAQLALLGSAVFLGLGPPGYLAAIIGLQLLLNLTLTRTLGRPSLRARARPQLLRRLGWTALLLGGPDLFLYLTSAILFAVLAAGAHAGQVGRLYVVAIIWSAGVNLLLYVFRVYAPRTALRLTGRAGRAGRARAARLAGWVVVLNAGWLVGAGWLIAAAGLAQVSSPSGQLLIWAGLLAARAPAMAGLLWANFQLENTDATAPRVVGLAALVGIAGTTAAGLALVPWLGGIGLVLAGAVGELAYALVVARRGAGRPAPDPVASAALRVEHRATVPVAPGQPDPLRAGGHERQ